MRTFLHKATPALVAVAAVLAALCSPAAGADERRRYVVVFEDSVAAPGKLAHLETEQRDGTLGFVYRHALKGFSAILPESEADALRRDPRVKLVSIDHPVAPLEELIETVDEGEVEIFEHSIPSGVARVFAPQNTALMIDGEEDLDADTDIAILDTGIDQTHPDLNVVARTDCTLPVSESEECKDGSGSDGHSHGTHVAGIAAAIDNEIGVTGVAPGARLWAVKVLSNGGGGFDSWIAAGIDWVTAHADEIEAGNLSLGCACSLPATAEALTGSAEAGVVYAVAAGNSNANSANFAPANHPDVITVSALADYDGKAGAKSSPTCNDYGLDDRLASFSNYGTAVEVAAPGVCIPSTVPGEGYGEKTGTSMAAPHVAAAAAILAFRRQPENLAGVEAVREEIEDAGNLEWTDTSADGEQEPLLDVGDADLFNFTPPPPPLPRFTADAYPATLGGEGTGSFTIDLGTFECDETSLESDPLAGQSAVLLLEPSYRYCYANGGEYPAAVTLNGCEYVLAARNLGPPYSGRVDVVCDEPEDAIEVKTYLFGTPESYSFLVCTTRIEPQSDLTSLGLANGKEAQAGSIVVSGKASGVDYENSGLCVSEPESHGNGTLGLEMALEGESGESPTDVEMTGHETTGIFVTGEESALAAAQPRLEAYPALSVEGDAPDTFSTGLGVVECANSAMSATPSGAFTQLQLDATYSYCHVTTEKVYPAEWDMNSCSYVYGVHNAGPPYSGDVDVACESEGDAIELRVYLSGTPEEHSGLICTLEIGPQGEAIGGVGFANAFEENELGMAEWGLAVETDAEGFEYQRYGICTKSETRTDGILSGIADVRWNGEE